LSPNINLVSLHFHATYASSTQPCRIRSPSHVDNELCSYAPRVSFSALQHIRIKGPFFALPVSRKRLKYLCPVSQKSHTQGLATLSVVSAPLNLGSLFQLPTLLSFALQSFPPLPWSVDPFESYLSAPALSYKTLSDFVPALQRLPPTEKAVSLLLLTQRISLGQDLMLSWAFGPLRSSPFLHP